MEASLTAHVHAPCRQSKMFEARKKKNERQKMSAKGREE